MEMSSTEAMETMNPDEGIEEPFQQASRNETLSESSHSLPNSGKQAHQPQQQHSTTSDDPALLFESNNHRDSDTNGGDDNGVMYSSTSTPFRLAKTVYFYREGDRQRPGLRMAVHPNRYRSMDALMTELTGKMPELSYGVRAVFTPKGRNRVDSLEDLTNDGRYVCSQNVRRARAAASVDLELVRPPASWHHGKPPSGKRADNQALRNSSTTSEIGRRRTRVANPMTRRQQENGGRTVYAHSDSEYSPAIAGGDGSAQPLSYSNGGTRRMDCKRIYVRRNAQPDLRRHVVLLNRRTAKSFEHILDDLSGVFLMQVRRVYTEDGVQVESLSAIFNGPDQFVVAGYEPFRAMRQQANPSRLANNNNNWTTSNGHEPRPPATSRTHDRRPVGAASGVMKKSKGVWRVLVSTRGEDASCGTTSRVFITVYGKTGASDAIPLSAQPDENGQVTMPFQAGQMDEFEISIGAVRDITKIRMSHDNTGPSPGWLLSEVQMQDVDTGETLLFKFNRWLDRSRDDGEICRELATMRPKEKTLNVVKYQISVITGDCWNASTDANVFITLFGTQGDSGVRQLCMSVPPKSKLFQKGQTDVFLLEAVDLGALRRCIVGHDGSGPGFGWFLDKITVKSIHDTPNVPSIHYEFPCSRWLDEGEDDSKTTRELKVVDNFMQDVVEKEMWEYEKWKFRPGNEISVYSRVTDHALRILKDHTVDACAESKDPFSVFKVLPHSVSNQSKLGNVVVLQSVMLPSFHLSIDRNRLVSTTKLGANCEFRIRLQPDRTVLMESVKFPQQHIHVNKAGVPVDPRAPSSSPGKVFHIACKGILRDQGVIMFCTSLTQTLSVEHDNSLHATGKRNRLAHFRILKVASGIRMFESVVFPEQFLRIRDGRCDCLGTGDLYCHFRVAKFPERGFVTLESLGNRGLFVGMSTDGKIRPTVDTGDKNVRLYPELIQFGLKEQKADIMKIEQINPSPADTVARPIEEEPILPISQLEDDKSSETSRDYVTENDWKLFIGTVHSAQRGSIYIVVYGEDDNSGPILLGAADNEDGVFVAGNTDEFKINLADIGNIYKIRLELHPDDWVVTPYWSVDEVIMENCISEDRIAFNFNGRGVFSLESSDHELSRECGVEGLPVVHYTVVLYTGDMPGAESTARMFISLMGQQGDSGRRTLHNGQSPLVFSSAQTNEFQIESVYLRDLKHCLIGHDSDKPGEGWFCSKVVVFDPLTQQEVVFPCNCWLDAGMDDGEVIRILNCERPEKPSESTPVPEDVTVEDLEGIERDGNRAQALVESITEQVIKNVEDYHSQGKEHSKSSNLQDVTE